MALPTVADAKAYLKIEHAAEDALLAQLIAQATAAAQRFVRRPLATSERTFVELAPQSTTAGRHVLYLPTYPVDAESLSVFDANDVELDPDTYVVDAPSGIVTARVGEAFANGPYQATCQVGLQHACDYAAAIEPDLSAAILDILSDRYQRRNPAAQTEAAGGGVSTTYASTGDGLPPRAVAALERHRQQRSFA